MKNPAAQALGKLSAKKRNWTSEDYRNLALKRYPKSAKTNLVKSSKGRPKQPITRSSKR